MKQKNKEWEQNQIMTPTVVFMESYNRITPDGFPRVTVKVLREFQKEYPTLFKDPDEWSIDKHRKKLMDWLSSHSHVS